MKRPTRVLRRRRTPVIFPFSFLFVGIAILLVCAEGQSVGNVVIWPSAQPARRCRLSRPSRDACPAAKPVARWNHSCSSLKICFLFLDIHAWICIICMHGYRCLDINAWISMHGSPRMDVYAPISIFFGPPSSFLTSSSFILENLFYLFEYHCMVIHAWSRAIPWNLHFILIS